MKRMIISLLFVLLTGVTGSAQTTGKEAVATADTVKTAVSSPDIAMSDHNAFLLYLLFLILIAIFLTAVVVFMESRKYIRPRFARKVSATIVLITSFLAVYRLFHFFYVAEGLIQVYTAGILLLLILIGIDAIRNLFAWITIVFTDHPAPGEYIHVNGFMGQVVKINMQGMILQDDAGSKLHVPNRLLLTREWFKEDQMMVDLHFYAPLHSDIRKIQDIIREAARISLYINLDFEPVIEISQVLKEEKIWLAINTRVRADHHENLIRLKNDLQARVTSEFIKEKLVN